ncbi:hypothetical protein CHU98_g8292 [Xylaria longipes]|nr:hypothetical protein CHU98_g8292 [Xylaria longipes]
MSLAPFTLGTTMASTCGSAASVGIRKVYFHLGARSEYSAFTPLPYDLKNETLVPGIRAGWYAHYFVARVVRDTSFNCSGRQRSQFRVAALPGANSSSLSGFAVYGDEAPDNNSKETSGGALRKLVFLDMGVWNGTEGLSNPSTLSATDGTMFSTGLRPVSTFEVSTPWSKGAGVRVVRLTAPGTNAKSNISVAGTVFDDRTGEPVVGGEGARLGDEYSEIIQVGDEGVVKFDLRRAEAVLLEIGSDDENVDCGEDGQSGDSDGSPPGTSGSSRVKVHWKGIVAAGLVVGNGFTFGDSAHESISRGETSGERFAWCSATPDGTLSNLSPVIVQKSQIYKSTNLQTYSIFSIQQDVPLASAVKMPFLTSTTESSSQQRAPTSDSEPNVNPSVSEQQSQTGDSSSGATGAGVNTGAGTSREKTEAEIEADRLYEEAIEEEYAKREGGA